jgi:hypothetical protein
MDLLSERGTFESAPLSENGFEIQDSTNDTFVFTPAGAPGVLGLHADITRASMKPGSEAWNVSVELAKALPADPGMPVNIDLFVADVDKPVAPTGVFRAGINHGFMLLFGTRTKWHADSWIYDSKANRWNKDDVLITFSATGNLITMTIPYSALPKNIRGTARFFALASQSGITAVDIAPGKELPTLKETGTITKGQRTFSFPHITAGIVGALIIILAGWMILRRKRGA